MEVESRTESQPDSRLDRWARWRGEQRARDGALVALGAVASAALAAWVFHLHVFPPPGANMQGDVLSHIHWAEQLDSGARRIGVRPLLQLFIIAVAWVPGVDHALGAVVVLTGSIVATYVLTLRFFAHLGGAPPRWVLVLLAVTLTVVSGIYAPMVNPRMYGGTGTPNIWHNPTQVLMIPFGLAALLMASSWLEVGRRRAAVSTALLLVATALIKPNFVLAFLPAMVVYVAVRERHRVLGTVLMALPVVAVLALQYLRVFSGETGPSGGGSGVGFGLISRPGMRFVWALLALVFPLIVLYAAPPHLRRHRALVIAWIMVVVAFVQRMLLVETGPRADHGNWHWGYFAAMKVLFVASAGVLARLPTARPAVVAAWCALTLHAWSGLLYVHQLVSGQGFL